MLSKFYHKYVLFCFLSLSLRWKAKESNKSRPTHFYTIIIIMKLFLTNLLDYIYKKKCYFCKNSKSAVKMCPDCFESLDLAPLGCQRIIDGANIYVAGVYEKNLQKLIRGLKYHNQKDLAFYQAKFMWEYFKQIAPDKKFQIVPVPLYKTRQKRRKYNHMALVAQEFAKLSGWDTNFDLIKRIKDTKPQYKLKISERRANLKNAFEIDKSKLKPSDILILDDIVTTGSTFEQMIAEFKKNNIGNITCFATTGVN